MSANETRQAEGLREATINRTTSETQISLGLRLDGSGSAKVSTGVPFFDHMLSLFAKHGLFDLSLKAEGDLEIDAHHTVEDVGIVLGQALKEALKDKTGIRRYGFFLLPMDEVLAEVAVDISGRPNLVYQVELPFERIGAFETSLVPEFLKALVNQAGLTLHVRCTGGTDAHHVIEAIFKGLGRALDMATGIDPRVAGVPSTKGVL